MKNPINQLNAQLSRLRGELGPLQEKHRTLQREHSKLLQEWVKQENELEEFKDSVEDMCRGCAGKGSDICDVCPLRALATKHELW